MLRVNNLSCLRGERRLWQDLSFELCPGQLLQITGANGSGKTSLLRILAGLSPPATGAVHWQGEPKLNYLGHQPAVKNELTVAENLQFNGRQFVKSSLIAALAQVGLAAHINHWGYQLSQGQKQRLALARILLNSAPLWILDEPFAGLDTEMIANVQLIFADYIEQGGALVLTTHRPLTLAALTSRTSFLHLCSAAFS